jgi:proline iminopeptidase
MKTTIFTILFLATIVANGQSIYTKTFGNSKDKPVIFLHGGPGYNCVNFEATTAQQLADKGFFVIVYDRRGEGRSKDPNAKFTFNETFDDLNNLYNKYKLTKSILIGHSFGGVVAALFAEANPKKVQSIILVGAPVSLQVTFKNIMAKSKIIYESKKDSVNLNYISMLENMDTTSIEYSSYCFGHAMQNGFYTPKNPTAEAKSLYSTFRTDTLLKKYASQMTYQAPQGFWKNEKYTTIDLTNNIENLKKKKIKIFGLYGKDDGLYSAQQVADLQKQIGMNNLKYFDSCSHNVFIDQQKQFIEALTMWTK